MIAVPINTKERQNQPTHVGIERGGAGNAGMSSVNLPIFLPPKILDVISCAVPIAWIPALLFGNCSAKERFLPFFASRVYLLASSCLFFIENGSLACSVNNGPTSSSRWSTLVLAELSFFPFLEPFFLYGQRYFLLIPPPLVEFSSASALSSFSSPFRLRVPLLFFLVDLLFPV